MPINFPPFLEKDGALSATGVATETVFRTPVAATTFLPSMGNTLDYDPGWFSPELMMATRDLHVFNLYGEAKLDGALDGPLMPSNAIIAVVAAIGQDNQPAAGVTGSTPTSSTTLNGALTSGTSTFTLTSATGYAIGSIIQVDSNNTVGPTTAEVRKIATLAGASGTVDRAWTYNHNTGATVNVVVAPFTHTITQTNTLPSLTVEKNIGNFQSLQFAGTRVGKLSIKAPVANQPVTITADVSASTFTVLDSPTAVSVVNELPFVFTEASLTVFGTPRYEASNVELDIDNGLKQTWTYGGNHGPNFLTPLTVHGSGKLDLVFDSLDDATYGDYTKMTNGTLGTLVLSFAHPSSTSTITFTLPQIALTKYVTDTKMNDVVMGGVTYEATRPLTGTSQYTIGATIANSIYLPY